MQAAQNAGVPGQGSPMSVGFLAVHSYALYRECVWQDGGQVQNRQRVLCSLLPRYPGKLSSYLLQGLSW